MKTRLLKGKPVANKLQKQLKIRVEELSLGGIIPKLAAILVGDDPASQVYVHNKSRAFKDLNCKSQTYKLLADFEETQNDIIVNIRQFIIIGNK